MAARFRLGLDTYSYHIAAPVWEPVPPEPLTLEAYLDRAAELGVEGLALADMRHLGRTDAQAVAELKAGAERRGLYVELGTGGVDVDHLRSVLRLGRELGGSVVRTFVSIGSTWATAQEYPQALKRVVQALRQVTGTCEETGVALAIENHQDLTSRELAQLLDEVDHPLVGACWDTGNSLAVFEHPLKGLRNVADRTFTVHFKSYALLPHAGQANPGGYVLVGVPVEHNRETLAETLALLARRSPAEELHINVEAAVEYIPVTPARPGWRPEYAAAAGRILNAYGLSDASAPASQANALAAWLPREDMAIEELLSLEDRLVRESVRQARALLAEFPRVRTDGQADCGPE